MAERGEKIRRLRDFFADSFSAGELEMFLAENGYPEVASAVHERSSPIVYCFKIAQELDLRGLIDEAFFDRLRRERPKKVALIGRLQEFSLVEEESSSRPSASALSSGTRKTIHPEPPSFQHESSVTHLVELPQVKSIDLALSGGGFRATLFHLGVIAFLYDRGFWSESRSSAASRAAAY